LKKKNRRIIERKKCEKIFIKICGSKLDPKIKSKLKKLGELIESCKTSILPNKYNKLDEIMKIEIGKIYSIENIEKIYEEQKNKIIQNTMKEKFIRNVFEIESEEMVVCSMCYQKHRIGECTNSIMKKIKIELDKHSNINNNENYINELIFQYLYSKKIKQTFPIKIFMLKGIHYGKINLKKNY